MSRYEKIRLHAKKDDSTRVYHLALYKGIDRKGIKLDINLEREGDAIEFVGTERNLRTILDAGNLIATLILASKHDETTYRRAYADLAADGPIVNGLAHKVIKIHWIWGQAAEAQATVEGYFRDAVGGNIIGHFRFNDREVFNPSFAPYPAAMFQSAIGGAFYLDYTTVGQTYWMVIYTDVDTE